MTAAAAVAVGACVAVGSDTSPLGTRGMLQPDNTSSDSTSNVIRIVYFLFICSSSPTILWGWLQVFLLSSVWLLSGNAFVGNLDYAPGILVKSVPAAVVVG